jgi:hypothetical protein
MRSELIDLLSRYVELDKELLDLNFEQEGDQVALMLSIPVIRAKDEEEIDAAIKEHEEMLKAAAQKAEQEEKAEDSDAEAETETDNEQADEEVVDTNEEDQTIIDEETVSSDADNEEEQNDAEKADAIVKELNEVPKIIKKKDKNGISAPEELNSVNGNPFKSEDAEEKETSLENQQ